MIYLTFNDQPSGVYRSQVTDVVKCWRSLGASVKLVAVISGRNFFKNRRIIKGWLKDAIVVPAFPGVHRWRKNVFLLKLLKVFWDEKTVMARGIYAWNIAKSAGFRAVGYDGRGAVSAEFSEYGVVSHPSLLAEVESLENKAVNDSSVRIAVSDKLVDYWKEKFNYKGKPFNDHVVIPCTIGNMQNENVAVFPEDIGLQEDNVILVFSGSVSGWQSLNSLYPWLRKMLSAQDNIRILFLSGEDPIIEKLDLEFPKRIKRMWVKPEEVITCLRLADYGILFRDSTVTNKVSSPVKFAEYLSAGLPVFISPEVGDFSKFVEVNNAGFIIGEEVPKLEKVSPEEKARIKKTGTAHFSKQSPSIKEKYQWLLKQLV